MFKHKFKASFIHFSLSAVILSLIMALIVYFWFPTPFLGISDFKEIALILISVDLVLGPLLTFIAYNPSKKSLKLDLSVIVAIQIMALSYGLYSLYLSHPLYISYYDKGFTLISTYQATPEKAKHKDFKISKLSSPKISFLNLDDKMKNQLFTEMLNGGANIEARAEFYEPYQDHLAEIIENSLDPRLVFKMKGPKEKLDKFIQQNGNSIDDYIFVPLNSGSKQVVWVLKKDTGSPVDILDVPPLRITKKVSK